MGLEDFELRVRALEQRLRPIAERRIDITEPGWVERARQHPRPLDEAGMRREAEALLAELVQFYRTAEAPERQAARVLFSEYRAFEWAASLPASPTTEDGFRQQLLLFSLKDQGPDSRDALLMLQHLCRRAREGGVSTMPILRKVAELSSDVNKYGMGSTREMLLKARGTE